VAKEHTRLLFETVSEPNRARDTSDLPKTVRKVLLGFRLPAPARMFVSETTKLAAFPPGERVPLRIPESPDIGR
jgi:hypothetical protein